MKSERRAPEDEKRSSPEQKVRGAARRMKNNDSAADRKESA